MAPNALCMGRLNSILDEQGHHEAEGHREVHVLHHRAPALLHVAPHRKAPEVDRQTNGGALNRNHFDWNKDLWRAVGKANGKAVGCFAVLQHNLRIYKNILEHVVM